MSVSAVAPTPFYHDPDRLQIGMPQPRVDDKASGTEAKRLDMFADEEGPSFWDVLDVINPLQHIPLVNDIYRDLTGDQIGVGARLAGGTLFGGVLGLAAAAINVAVEETTGKNVGGHVLALFKDDDAPAAPDAPAATQLASTAIPQQAAAPAAATVDAKDAAPVIALPDTGPAAHGQPMMFTFDGAQPVAASHSAAAAPPAVTAAPAVAQVTAKPLGAPARYLPTPARNSNINPAPMPAVTVPVANGSSRSNVPITGRAPNAAVPHVAANAATTAAMQRALAGQDANHPMAPPMDANGQTAANPDWFSAAWGQALDKYQRANQLNGKPPSTVTLE